jgi:hypothetical protein
MAYPQVFQAPPPPGPATHPLVTPLAYELVFNIPVEPTVCYESLQSSMSPPTLSALEAQILTSEPQYVYTELFRRTFLENCTTSTWNVSQAKTVIWYANSTGLGNILNDLYPGLLTTGIILCKRQRTTYVDAALHNLYPIYRLFLEELGDRGVPVPHQNLLAQYLGQVESPTYRVCASACGIVLASILTLRNS